MSNLVRLRAELMSAGSTFLQPIRDSEFLSAIKHRSAIPGGTCEFDLPDYFFWLIQPADARMRTFNEWLGLLRPLCDAIAELLWLTRRTAARARRWRSAAPFTSPSTATRPISCLRISLPAPRDCTPRSAAATTAAACAFSPGMA